MLIVIFSLYFSDIFENDVLTSLTSLHYKYKEKSWIYKDLNLLNMFKIVSTEMKEQKREKQKDKREKQKD